MHRSASHQKKALWVAGALLAGVLSAPPAHAAPPKGWNAAFTDAMCPGGEGNWNYTDGGPSINAEHECYRHENVYRTSDCVMHLKTELMLNDPLCGGNDMYDWRSGEAIGKYNMSGGNGSANSWMTESRLQIPNANGYWPAFWAVDYRCDLINNCPTWPPEFDIMEVMFNNMYNNKSTTWTGLYPGQVGHTIDMGTSFDMSADYHVFTGFWFNGYSSTYIDGARRAEWWNGDVPTGTMKLVLNTAVAANGSSGGAWSDQVRYLNVDDVRIWSLGSLDGGKKYRITPKSSNLSFNIEGGLASGKRVLSWPYYYPYTGNNADWQIIWFGGDEYEIRAWYDSNICLDSYGVGSGGQIGTWTCNSGVRQRWYMYDAGQGHVQIVSKDSGLCLDTTGETQGTSVKLWTCSGNDRQSFRFNQN